MINNNTDFFYNFIVNNYEDIEKEYDITLLHKRFFRTITYTLKDLIYKKIYDRCLSSFPLTDGSFMGGFFWNVKRDDDIFKLCILLDGDNILFMTPEQMTMVTNISNIHKLSLYDMTSMMIIDTINDMIDIDKKIKKSIH